MKASDFAGGCSISPSSVRRALAGCPVSSFAPLAATDASDLGPDLPEDADTLAAPPPDLTLEEAGQVARELFGISGSPSSLGSERDQNFRIESSAGSFVLKVSNSAEAPGTIDMQTKAMLHIAVADPELPIARVCPTAEGRPWSVLERNGRRHLIRLVTFLEGSELGPSDLGPAAFHELGATVAKVGRALRGFFHPAGAGALLWDVKEASRLRPLLGYIDDPARSALVVRALDAFEERALPAFPRLRAQMIHGDLSLSNVLFDGDRPAAVIDFGDMTHSPVVCDLGVTLAAVLRGGENTFETTESVLRGYGTVTLLEDEEVDVLADAVAARLAATVLISAWRVGRFGENSEYITAYDAGSWATLELFDELGSDVVRKRFRRAAAPALSRATARPTALTGRSTSELVEERRRLLGSAHLPLSYDRPIHMVRAEGVWMFDSEGRRYLDAYNNVPVVGHGHPRVVEAVARQARLLNTNTRYLHEAVLELAERLTSTMPDELDTCVFVNSGSEANDLVWRMATAVTGRTGGIVAAHAYHGVTAALTDLSPSEWPKGERPAHVETVPAPDGYRGAHRRAEAGWAERYAASITEAAQTLSNRSHEVAAMLLDPAWTSAGIFTDAAAYLPEALHRAHEAGGLFVADEVQAGFGRVGSKLWSFEPSGIVPDFVVLGKPMGNGHPVAALITRGALSDDFAKRQAPFFSTFGGNPVACAAALAVLDVIEEEKLLDRAAETGRYLRDGLEELGRRHELLGDVRGEGLLIGVELVQNAATREPAPQTARSVANGMRDRGVLIGTTGIDANVLKIRPPLPFGCDHADELLAKLDAALSS